jgi:phosphoglucosamine mutase
MVDELGREFTGDHLLYILAVQGGLKGAVATVMTNLGAENALRAKGVDLHRTDVGDRYVLEGLGTTGYKLGGEQSGHIILPEILMTGDGMLAAIQVMRAVRASGKSLAEWRDEVPLLPQKLINIPVPDKTLVGHENVRAYVESFTESLAGQGRVLVRRSGTEDIVRVMVESENADRDAAEAAAEIERLMKELVAA